VKRWIRIEGGAVHAVRYSQRRPGPLWEASPPGAETGDLWDGTTLTKPPAPVPAEVHVSQALLALEQQGLLDAYEAWTQDPARTRAQQIEIAHRAHWQRNNALVVTAAAALGITDEQLDELFRLAATL